ncbi:hypothetical protein B0H67DRAFT_299525 [Lasiosphaeris hirsuta]|uniref:Uncharacterized protein n=1 Tax=Lasiosphaeris hirsuta TaxID=260670 RepID=A0AA40DPV9_9PEZI|nr:hypothetical protein B0H67DRAFT_299525 [Lasiosphaeris hirsuta]
MSDNVHMVTPKTPDLNIQRGRPQTEIGKRSRHSKEAAITRDRAEQRDLLNPMDPSCAGQTFPPSSSPWSGMNSSSWSPKFPNPKARFHLRHAGQDTKEEEKKETKDLPPSPPARTRLRPAQTTRDEGGSGQIYRSIHSTSLNAGTGPPPHRRVSTDDAQRNEQPPSGQFVEGNRTSSADQMYALDPHRRCYRQTVQYLGIRLRH